MGFLSSITSSIGGLVGTAASALGGYAIGGPTGALVGGGLSLAGSLGAYEQNQISSARDAKSMEFESWQARRAMNFAADQSRTVRDYNAQQARTARDFSAGQASRAMDFSARQAGLNRQFQRQMSSTAYRRAATDLRAAGLNPILLARQPQATTPTGAMAQGVAASGTSASATAPGGSMGRGKASMPVDRVQAGIASARAASDMYQQNRQIGSQVALQRKQGANLAAGTMTQHATARKLGAETSRIATEQERTTADAQFIRQKIKTEEQNTANARSAAEIKANEAYLSRLGREYRSTPTGQKLYDVRRVAEDLNIPLSHVSRVLSALGIAAGGTGVGRAITQGLTKGTTR